MTVDEALRIYQQTFTEIGIPTYGDEEKFRAGLAAILDRMEREHGKAVIDAARRGYENGQRDLIALQDMGF